MRRGFQNAWYGLAGLLLLVTAGAAQVQVGDNLNMNLNGALGVGYNDIWGNSISSSHSVDFNGTATLSGFYYNPNFLSFAVTPFYDQSNANSTSKSIFHSSGLELSSNIFAGSRFPGSIGYSKSWNSQGEVGIPGSPNFTTQGSGQGFNIGWGAFLQGLPSLAATFNTGSTNYTVFGTDQNGSSDFKSLNLRSNYTISGFNLTAFYDIGHNHADIPQVFGNQTVEHIDSDNNGWGINGSHNLPWHGSASASYSHSYYNSNYLGYAYNGSINTVNASAGVNPTQKLSFSLSMGYTDNFAGTLYQTIVPTSVAASASTAQVAASSTPAADPSTTTSNGTSTNSSSNALYFVGNATYAIAPNMILQAYAQRRQQTYAGTTYGADTFGLSAIYSRPLLGGFLNTALNFADNVSDQISGTAFSFSGNVGYNRNISDWVVSGNFGYAQNVQSYLIVYTNSYYSYSGSVRHRIRNVVWNATAAGSHNLITQQPHTGNGAQSYSTSLGARRLTLSAAYNKLDGYGLLGSNGVNPPPGLPPGVFPPDLLLFYGGTSYSFGLGTSPVRHMTIGASFSHTESNTLSGLTASNNHNEQLNFLMHYQFRKLTLTSGYGRLVQGISATGTPPSAVNSFYIGLSRYFNFF